MNKLGKIVADFSTSLATKISVGSTSATLQSATDKDSVALPTGTYFLTLSGDSSQKEYIVCTLTGTALTNIYNVNRQGVQASGAVREHRIGSSVSITNFAHIKYINDLLDGTTGLDASNPLEYDGTASITTANQLATKAYVDGGILQGAADASTTVKGISKLSSAPASATDPIAVGDNDPRLPTTDEKDAMTNADSPASGNPFLVDTDTTATPTADKIPIADGCGKLDDGWIGDGITEAKYYSLNSETDNTWFTTIIPLLPKDKTAVGDALQFTGGWTDNNNYDGSGDTKTRVGNYSTFTSFGANGHFAEKIMGASGTNYAFGGGKDIRFKVRLKLPSETVDRSFGFVVTGSTLRGARTTTLASVMFTVANDTLYAVNADGTTNTNTDISSGVTVTNWNTYEVILDDGNSVKFYVNGTLLATHTTNLPSSGDAKIGFGVANEPQYWELSDIIISQEL